MKRIVLYTFAILMFLVFLGFLAFRFTPWPSALLIRSAFNKEAVRVNEALAKHVPKGTASILDLQYDHNDTDAKLDVHFPDYVTNIRKELPVIVWVHGGGWISGHKEHIANYCRILASYGYISVSIDYSIAPEKKYPMPVIQANTALGYLLANATKLNIDTANFIMAGDSGGAHIVAQLANAIADAQYAHLIGINPSINSQKLSGMLLYCGPYDAGKVNLQGNLGSFLRTVLWSYSGKKNFKQDAGFKPASVINYISAKFPPSFISAGNGDPLLTHSKELADKLQKIGVDVDTLFFPAAYRPVLPHEYQFNLDSEAGRMALSRSLRFLQRIVKPNVEI